MHDTAANVRVDPGPVPASRRDNGRQQTRSAVLPTSGYPCASNILGTNRTHNGLNILTYYKIAYHITSSWRAYANRARTNPVSLCRRLRREQADLAPEKPHCDTPHRKKMTARYLCQRGRGAPRKTSAYRKTKSTPSAYHRLQRPRMRSAPANNECCDRSRATADSFEN